MQDNSTLGRILPHTEAKHDILKYHLGAWFPILASRFDRIQYIDGFSGPGEYEGGEQGSPILALNTISGHTHFPEFSRAAKVIDFLFVDERQDYVDSLQMRVDEKQRNSSFNIAIRQGQFESILTSVLDDADRSRRQLPPTLLFLDPFGSSGFSMQLLSRLSDHNRIDMLINFNYLDLNRWLLPDETKHITLDKLYGSSRWRPALNLEGDVQKNFLIKEYGEALLEAGWRNTNFEMINKNNQTQYYLFFGAKQPRGMEVMKQAMRSVSTDGLFRYSDRTDPNQPILFGLGMDEEYAGELAEHLFGKYMGKEASKEEIVDNEIAWHPRWVHKNLTEALRILERSTPSRIKNVRNGDERRRQANSFPPGCLITFADYSTSTLL